MLSSSGVNAKDNLLCALFDAPEVPDVPPGKKQTKFIQLIKMFIGLKLKRKLEEAELNLINILKVGSQKLLLL